MAFNPAQALARAAAACAAFVSLSFMACDAKPAFTAQDAAVPRYQHIFVIVEENKDFERIVGDRNAPNITALAREYGVATHYYAVTHPSEPNYVALVGGYTYGIRDDDAYYCVPRDTRPFCSHSMEPGYVTHTIDRPNLATQLEHAGLTWKNYLESIPEPGSLAVIGTERKPVTVPSDVPVYASKHSGFMNFLSVQRDPHRAEHITGFATLTQDLKSGSVPNFSLIVPNLCNEMHGSSVPGTPEDCRFENLGQLIARGDRNVGRIVNAIMQSPVWRQPGNSAIVITFDEDDGGGTSGCCGIDKSDPANAGGGHVATVVITNHGPRHLTDPTPYSHYSLLRTIEDAFGIHDYLGRAAAPDVHSMKVLFGASFGSKTR